MNEPDQNYKNIFSFKKEGFNLYSIISLALVLVVWLFPRDVIFPERTKLEISLESYSRLIDEITSKVDKNNLTFLYRGQEVKNLNYAEFLVTNSGSKPIRREDVSQEIKITFFDRIRIIGVSASPENILNLNQSDSSIIINADLINPGEKILIKLLFDYDQNFTSPITLGGDPNPCNVGASGRIAGAKEIGLIIREEVRSVCSKSVPSFFQIGTLKL